MFIDINGSSKGPNTAGKDLFFFYINDKGKLTPSGDDWNDKALSLKTKANACSSKAYCGGLVCAEKIIRDGWEINYW